MLIVGAAGEEVLLGLHFSVGTVRADTALFGQPVLAISLSLSVSLTLALSLSLSLSIQFNSLSLSVSVSLSLNSIQFSLSLSLSPRGFGSAGFCYLCMLDGSQ